MLLKNEMSGAATRNRVNPTTVPNPSMMDLPIYQETMSTSKIPVTVITGLLGAGKTTLLRRILTSEHGRRILVVQNEFSSDMGIEKPTFIGPSGSSLPDIYELPNGCLCCSVRDNLILTLESVLNTRSHQFSSIIVETSGVADPEKVINIFWTDDELEGKTYLDAVITVVDSTSILHMMINS